ncbi:hypothetical protein Ciccas_001023 [Cichlidogyrus casuarinus]|uniref:SH3 domain-containing protein n=1 Tax=Cichlidogyrus casuarinus TaxID=1844966 RepID=A0ABD2QMC7_9PLAT
MVKQVVVKYTFDAQSEVELSVRESEQCTVVDESVGEGWWMLRNDKGQTGLVPIDFVTVLESTAVTSQNQEFGEYNKWDSWDDSPSDEEKSGGEELFLTSDPVTVEKSEVGIDSIDGTWLWQARGHPFTCKLDDFKKGSKFKGLKSYIEYSLRPSFKNVEEFVKERQKLLQQWLNRVCQHPILSQSKVFQHFITCNDEKQWKIGKRDAENDKFQGGRFYLSVYSPERWSTADAL